ncbi:alpha-N-acetylgalactosaminide alpha-2,6-sialyltransferase 1-like isoform X2 [Poecilia reticulata]|uniref:alpha-N-acetylgalactosaminide alpha-2,6-sialyltransferase 1-like isoform X2 n=1 Tax=Poecilia reticulata TaxID=8081 RepID=UPI0004A29DBF|nr:PREDICTED: alpha-N-acetylgalactosaminide alpha-2,6-sialyltransferase 1-like isoform X2 [Poecilia reticulata]
MGNVFSEKQNHFRMQKTAFFSLVLVLAVSFFLFILSWENYEGESNWKVFSGKVLPRGEDTSINVVQMIRKLSLLSGLPTEIERKTNKTNIYSLGNVKTQSRAPESPVPIMDLSSFKKLPQWSFEDIYNLDAPITPTTCPQSLRNSKDEDFQKAFLPNIRMFLHKDNFNIREWNRLSHFNNPFGFMGMKYSDVKPVVKLISKPKEPLLLPKPGGDGCVHCAVVGTGGILNGSKMGAEIDAHDYVFRMNGAVINGYEEDVGTKTSVYVHTAHSITASLEIFKEYGYKSAPHDEGIKYVLIPEGLRDYQWLQGLLKGEKVSSGQYQDIDPRAYYSGQFSEDNVYVLHQDFLRYVRNRYLSSNDLSGDYWAIVRPTNGAFTLFVALHTCDTVSAYGFMTEDYSKYSNYYAEKLLSEVIFYINHDLILEKNLWKSFHDKKILKLYQRTGSEKRTDS